MMRLALFAPVLALVALAGCSKGGASGDAPAAPVKAVAPPAGQSWTDTVVRTPDGYRMGNPDAPVKLVEYGSRLCPVCGAFSRDAYQPLTTKYVASGKVSYEFREFMVHGAPDLPPALLGLCVGTASYFPLLEQMYQHQPEFDDKLANASPAVQARLKTATPLQAIGIMADQMGLIDFVRQRGLPEAKARACLGDQAMIDKLTKVTQDKTNDGTVAGTPTFILNNKGLGTLTWPQLEQALKTAGA